MRVYVCGCIYCHVCVCIYGVGDVESLAESPAYLRVCMYRRFRVYYVCMYRRFRIYYSCVCIGVFVSITRRISCWESCIFLRVCMYRRFRIYYCVCTRLWIGIPLHLLWMCVTCRLILNFSYMCTHRSAYMYTSLWGTHTHDHPDNKASLTCKCYHVLPQDHFRIPLPCCSVFSLATPAQSDANNLSIFM